VEEIAARVFRPLTRGCLNQFSQDYSSHPGDFPRLEATYKLTRKKTELWR
jgi:hypothetical protein